MPTQFLSKYISYHAFSIYEFHFKCPVSVLNELKMKKDNFNDNELIIGDFLYKNYRVKEGKYLDMKTFDGIMSYDERKVLSQDDLNGYKKREKRKVSINSILNQCQPCTFTGLKRTTFVN